MSMDYVPIADILEGKHVDKLVHLRGWIYRERKQKDAVFLILRDHSGTIQVVVKDSKLMKEAQDVTVESAVTIVGTAKTDKRAPGGYEIQASGFKIFSKADRYPIVRDKSEEFLRDVRHLWVRDPQMAAILKVRSEVFAAIRDFYHKRGYYEVQSPSFTKSAAEGGSTLFEVKYFQDKVYLTQSWQLYAEAVMFSLEKIFTLAPSFRAERSRTIRHLAEYWHHEMETAWMGFDEMLKFEEELIIFIAQHVAKHCKEELILLKRDVKELEPLKTPFKRMTYTEACKVLGKKYGYDLTDADERQLVEKLGSPVFLTHFPRDMKAFYMRPDPKDKKAVLAADLLLPGVGEVIGGSERIFDLKELKESLKIFGLKAEDYKWYLDLRKYGTIPHSGFGLGIERLVMWLTGTKHIMDTIPFPRTMDRLTP